LLLQKYLEHRISGLGRLALAGTCALLASFALFGLLGLALRWCRRERPLLRYLADASYWIYLVHFPLVGLAHVLLVPVPGTALVKFAVVTVLVLALGLSTYQLFVRHTFLGRFLNGTKPAVAKGPHNHKFNNDSPVSSHQPEAPARQTPSSLALRVSVQDTT
jgi:peptidoglycan/LPS O-acetylase OafA/YrhL